MSWLNFLGFNLAGDDAIIAYAALGVLSSLFCVYRALLFHDPLASRAKSLTERYEVLRSEMRGPNKRTKNQAQMRQIRGLVERLSLLRSRKAEQASDRLAQAGWRGRDALAMYFFVKLTLPFAFGAIAVLVIYVLKIFNPSSAAQMAIALGAVALGAYAPDIYIKNVVTKRKQRILKALPDALDLLVVCTEAGQSLDAALARVAREIGKSFVDLADELSLTSIELGLLPERRKALDNLNRRVDIPAVRGVVNTLLQTERYGTPLAQALRVLAAEYRHERLMKAEEKAARLPATLTVPMMIFIMPPLFIVLIGPAILRTMDMLGRVT